MDVKRKMFNKQHGPRYLAIFCSLNIIGKYFDHSCDQTSSYLVPLVKSGRELIHLLCNVDLGSGFGFFEMVLGKILL